MKIKKKNGNEYEGGMLKLSKWRKNKININRDVTQKIRHEIRIRNMYSDL